MEALQVYSVPLSKKERIGTQGDGGYVIVKLDDETYDMYIGCGINDDVEFDKALLERFPHITGFVFDGTIPCKPSGMPSQFAFVPVNIGGLCSDITTNLVPFINKSKNVFMKMDIEGGEWEWITLISNEDLGRIKQLVIEIHYLFDYRVAAPRVKFDALKRLASMFYLVHVHGNNYTPDTYTTKGLPYVLECTYVRKDAFSAHPELNTEPFPTVLDFPNCPGYPDLPLTGWPFVKI